MPSENTKVRPYTANSTQATKIENDSLALPGIPSPALLWPLLRAARLGSRIATNAKVIAEPLTRATTGAKRCSRRPMPPAVIARPRASRRLAITVPVMLALTISTSPARRAVSVMISSAALPNKALSSAPTVGPRLRAISSVAVLSHTASGKMAPAESRQTAESPQPTHFAAIESGSSASRAIRIRVRNPIGLTR